jgi:Domain of unknown function (DUF397)
MSTVERDWFKSSRSRSGGGNCVEVSLAPGSVRIRDSKETGRGPLVFSPDAWHAFTTHLVR